MGSKTGQSKMSPKNEQAMLRFDSRAGKTGGVHFTVTNTSNKRVAYNVKCDDHWIGILKPGGSATWFENDNTGQRDVELEWELMT